MLHNFQIRGESLRLWQSPGESYEHVLMKALAYGIFEPEYPGLLVERRVGLRYKPDLIAIDEKGEFELWVECGMVTLTKTAWLMKHTTAKRLVICKIGLNVTQIAKQLREAVPDKYRPEGRLSIFNFVSEVADLTASKQIAKVSEDWYSVTHI